jgi:hypothetical protein
LDVAAISQEKEDSSSDRHPRLHHENFRQADGRGEQRQDEQQGAYARHSGGQKNISIFMFLGTCAKPE